MSTIVKYEFSEEEIKKLKKAFDDAGNNLPPGVTTFNEYLNHFVESAIATHIQFLSFNGSLSSVLDGADLDLSNINLDDIGNLMNGLFNEKSNKSDDKSKDDKKSPTSTSKKN
ncbi:MAG: hypothetical protein ACRC4M_00035 [Mycoplasma sp.]